MTSTNAIIAANSNILGVTQESLKNITGADSVPYIVPQSHEASSDLITLMIFNGGKHLLTGVDVEIWHTRGEFALNQPRIDVGTLHPGGMGKELGHGISPRPDTSGVDMYLANISTQSYSFSETLQFRHGKYALPWAFKFWVCRQEFKNGNGLCVPIKSESEIRWSDDLGDGKPVSKPPS
jgi:hypothetical protein